MWREKGKIGNDLYEVVKQDIPDLQFVIYKNGKRIGTVDEYREVNVLMNQIRTEANELSAKISKLKALIDASDNIVFFGGAGVSTESGLPDFKGDKGLYNLIHSENQTETPEYMMSARCLYKEPERFFENYRNNFNCLKAKPNITHHYLKKLEDQGKLKAIVTQNIDGLHQKAGSSNVFELHGTMHRCYCTKCQKEYPGEYIFETEGIPRCECGGIIRPDIVLYGEMLPEAYSFSQYYIYHADLLIVAGSSLTVEPANGLVRVFGGKHLVIINKTPTQYDNEAELVIHESLGNVISQLL